MVVARGDLARRVIFRADEADYLRWRADAARMDVTFSEWARLCLDAGRRVAAREGARVVPEVRVESKQDLGSARVDAPVGVGRLEGMLGSVAVDEQRERIRLLAETGGRCTADVAVGQRCFLCGKRH